MLDNMLIIEDDYPTYEFINKCQFPVPAKESAVVFGALPGGVLQLLRSSGTYNMSSSTAGTLNSPISVGEINITKCSSKYIRNCKQTTYLPAGEEVLWNSLYEGISGRKHGSSVRSFVLTNKVKDVSFEILHKIYPTQKTVKI